MPDTDSTECIRFLEKATRSQQLAQRFHLLLAFGVVVVGLVIVVVVHFLPGASESRDLAWLGTIGGGFVSTLSTLPIREFFNRRTKISAYEFLLDRFRSLSESGADEDERARVQERFWKVMDASLGS